MSLPLHYIRKIDQLVRHKGLKQKICSRNANPQRQLVLKAPRLWSSQQQYEEEDADLRLSTWERELAGAVNEGRLLLVRACLLRNRPGCLPKTELKRHRRVHACLFLLNFECSRKSEICN